MIYHDFHGLRLSALGLGCMRLPTRDQQIDREAVEEMVCYAMEQGINYFDTAWFYHHGESETVMGQVLGQYPRDKYFLATKFPGFEKDYFTDPERIFQTQLEKCQVDFFDFYLFHSVCQKNLQWYLDPAFGAFILQKKREGKIRHLGFSAHCSPSDMRKFLDAYGPELEFCQIQLNYLDWDLQNAREKVALLRSRNIPIWVMEPVRGGRLARLEPVYLQRLQALRPEETPPGWAFRFLQGIPGVTVVLSGLSDMQQLRENVGTFREACPPEPQELSVLHGIARDMIRADQVPCTGCSYCVDRCPQGIPIPEILKKYNEKDWSADIRCIGCGSCQKVCPQGIAIPRILDRYMDQHSESL